MDYQGVEYVDEHGAIRVRVRSEERNGEHWFRVPEAVCSRFEPRNGVAMSFAGVVRVQPDGSSVAARLVFKPSAARTAAVRYAAMAMRGGD